ncbi:MAG: VOC family protein [Bacteroidota bacterium]|nr:VOC family protein [Bacteroidota bacterium]
MKLNAGIITYKIEETKKFYTEVLEFKVKFENEFYILLETPNMLSELSFLLPKHPSQRPIFQSEFTGQGVYLTLEVDDVDKYYVEFNARNIPIETELRQEPWGDKHFTIVDPNGIGIDIVTYSATE